MIKRINIALPEKTIAVLDSVTTYRGRSGSSTWAKAQNPPADADDFPRRGETYLVAFDPRWARDPEDASGRRDPRTTFQTNTAQSPLWAAITSNSQIPHPREAPARTGAETGLRQPSDMILNQIRSIDRA
jgi:hypothetical protein